MEGKVHMNGPGVVMARNREGKCKFWHPPLLLVPEEVPLVVVPEVVSEEFDIYEGGG